MLEVASPPATPLTGWSSIAPSDLLGLFIGPGFDNVLDLGGTLTIPVFDMTSLTGSALDAGFPH
jgi:hypothetical protein